MGNILVLYVFAKSARREERDPVIVPSFFPPSLSRFPRLNDAAGNVGNESHSRSQVLMLQDKMPNAFQWVSGVWRSIDYLLFKMVAVFSKVSERVQNLTYSPFGLTGISSLLLWNYAPIPVTATWVILKATMKQMEWSSGISFHLHHALPYFPVALVSKKPCLIMRVYVSWHFRHSRRIEQMNFASWNHYQTHHS